MKKLILASLLFSTQLMSAPVSTKVSLIDSCTRKTTLVTTPNGTEVWIRISGLNIEEEVNLQVDYFPAGLLEDLSDKDHLFKRVKIKPYKNGKRDRIDANGNVNIVLDFPSHKTLYEKEQALHTGRIWNVEVKWYQEESRKAGTGLANVYRLQKSKDNFYQITNPEYCSWETDASVSSKLHTNETSAFMNVIHEYQNIYSEGTSRGLSLGLNTNANSMGPMVGEVLTAGVFSGWLFKEWQNTLSKKQYYNFSRKFVLSRNSSGVFAKRNSYTRKAVKRWAWVERGGSCGKYENVDNGFLDVGVETEDFYEMPKTIYGNEVEMNNFIKLTRKSIDTCGSHVNKGPEFATDVIPNGFQGLMFYYRNPNNK